MSLTNYLRRKTSQKFEGCNGFFVPICLQANVEMVSKFQVASYAALSIQIHPNLKPPCSERTPNYLPKFHIRIPNSVTEPPLTILTFSVLCFCCQKDERWELWKVLTKWCSLSLPNKVSFSSPLSFPSHPLSLSCYSFLPPLTVLNLCTCCVARHFAFIISKGCVHACRSERVVSSVVTLLTSSKEL
jgi:hypothetical protein